MPVLSGADLCGRGGVRVRRLRRAAGEKYPPSRGQFLDRMGRRRSGAVVGEWVVDPWSWEKWTRLLDRERSALRLFFSSTVFVRLSGRMTYHVVRQQSPLDS
jgi:hypothetical protein